MNPFLKIAGPISVGMMTSVACLAVTHNPAALEGLTKVGRMLGENALRATLTTLTARQ
jgi:hypothetical protein